MGETLTPNPTWIPALPGGVEGSGEEGGALPCGDVEDAGRGRWGKERTQDLEEFGGLGTPTREMGTS